MTKEDRILELQTGSWQSIKAAAIAVFGEDYEKPEGSSWEDQIEAIVDAELAIASPPSPVKKKANSSPKPEPKLNFDYQKDGNFWVCAACNLPVQTDSNNQKICPVANKQCPREAK